MNQCLNKITFQQIHIFLTVAETQSFIQASQILYLTQPAVSKSIARLEEQLGFPLFARSSRAVSLTTAGEQLYAQWQPLFLGMQQRYDSIRSQVEHGIPNLRLGFPNAIIPDPFLEEIRAMACQLLPAERVKISSGSPLELEETLMAHGFDAIFLPGFERFVLNYKKISYISFGRAPACILLSVRHSLASKESLTMEDILDQAFFMDGRTITADLEERFAPYGRTPRYREAIAPHQAFDLKFASWPSDAICLADPYLDIGNRTDVKKIPLV